MRDPTLQDPTGREEAEESAGAAEEAAEHRQGQQNPCPRLGKKPENLPAAWNASRRREIQPLNPHRRWYKHTWLVAPRRGIWMRKYSRPWWEICLPQRRR